MVSALLDTSIVVDVLRGYKPARTWLSSQIDLGITRIVWLEVLEGADNSREQRRAIKLLNEFEVVETIASDLDWATEQSIRYWLSHKIDVFDCLIAAVSHRLQLPLYTTNVKHFTPLLGALAQRPY
jgi:predicted nucleic acid-binding protein